MRRRQTEISQFISSAHLDASGEIYETQLFVVGLRCKNRGSEFVPARHKISIFGGFNGVRGGNGKR